MFQWFTGRCAIALVAVLLSVPAAQMVVADPRLSTQLREAGFSAWVRGYRARALRAGIPAGLVDQGLRSARYLPDVIRLDRTQFEFSKPIWTYLDTAVSADRIRNGRKMLRRYDRLLRQLQARYGVDRHVIVAIWGLESAYGTYMGRTDTVSALATLAYDGRRGAFFEQQLTALLRIAARGEVRLPVQGSWAGAMGHTQFIPTSYLAYAVDGDGDGDRDIWSDNPADGLASAAAYLRASGWRPGLPWGTEIRLPPGFDLRLAKRDIKRLPSEWARLGVTGVGGGRVPDHGRASILLPAGAKGVALFVFDNFGAIERYNTADAYVVAVGHLSDRLRGMGAFQTAWPRSDRPLTFDEKRELQRRLRAKGFYSGPVDGRIGPLTTQAVRAAQQARGVLPDGYASLSILQLLRRDR